MYIILPRKSNNKSNKIIQIVNFEKIYKFFSQNA
jgi:hypothetical protein